VGEEETVARVLVNDEVRLNYELQGQGRVVVLTPGLGDPLQIWDTDVPALSEKYAVLRWDPRGHGDSDKPDMPYTFEMHARDLAGLLRALGIRRVYAGGESGGGVIVQRFALDYPDSTMGAFLLATSSEVSERASVAWEARAVTALEHGVEQTLDAEAEFENANRSIRSVPAEYDAVVRSGHLKIPPEVYARIHRCVARYGWTAELRRLRMPVLILQGLVDRMTPPGGSVLLHRNIPMSQLIMMDDCSHMIRIDQPEQWRRHLLNFLDGVDHWPGSGD
jgi:3-oxoadipate enol-lactonase